VIVGGLRSGKARYMMNLKYAGGTVTMSDDACATLLAYAEALARNAGSDTVTVAVIGEDGEPTDADILIGPASQLLAVPSKASHRDFDDRAQIAYMAERTAQLQPPRPIATPDSPPEEDNDQDRTLGDL
jgi:hypothetical protein